jgi:CheY-like chemotaxis protein
MPDPIEILLADDSDVGRYVIATMLRRAGFVVREVSDGLAAVREATSQPPDLVILDVKMPGLDGLEACRRLKAERATSFVPVLLLSATFLDSADQAEGLDTGADAYLTQPVEAPVLVASVNSLLRARLAERNERRIATEWQVTFDAISDAVALVDSDGLVRRCNRAFGALAGIAPETAAGQPLDRLVPALSGTAIGPESGDRIFEVGERFMRLHIDELPDPESPAHVVLSLRDITAEAELARERERIFRRERLISTTLQQALVQPLLPTIPGLWLSARYALADADVAVGGDWFDAIRTADGVWLAIGDIAGHGVAAAAKAVQLRHNLRLLAEEGYGPAEAMSRLGDLLTAGELIETASVTIAAIDVSLTAALMVCAGHPPAILISADGRTRAIQEVHGPVLGYPGGRHEAVSVPLAEGDTLVLYTDGLVERRRESIDVGIDRLRKVLSESRGTDLVDRTFAALVPDAPLDDAAILAAHRLPSSRAQPDSGSTQSMVDTQASEWPS